jgi:hypothetical protein
LPPPVASTQRVSTAEHAFDRFPLTRPQSAEAEHLAGSGQDRIGGCHGGEIMLASCRGIHLRILASWQPGHGGCRQLALKRLLKLVLGRGGAIFPAEPLDHGL